MSQNGKSWIILAALMLAATPMAQCQRQTPSLRVATRLVSPFVLEEKGQLTGFSIELWNSIAAKLNAQTQFQTVSDVGALLAEVRAGRADLGIAAISINSERDREFDFSQPILESGLQILVQGRGDTGATHPFQGLVRLLLSPAMLVWLGTALLFILIPAHIVWFLERRHPEGIVAQKGYFPGIFHALWWAAGTLATQAEQMPRTGLARILAVFWMFTGVVFVAYFTAQLTASLTVEQIKGDISGPDDLPGKRVATTRNSTAAVYLREQKAQVQEFTQIEEAYKALEQKQVDAVVFDAPVLLYYATHDGKGQVQTVGSVFRKENYGIVFPSNSPYRKPVDGALLSLREDGTYQQIYAKWFGEK